MTEPENGAELHELDTGAPIWDRFYTVAPLVLIGTTEEDGSLDFAPKHMVTPLGWQNYFGFVCSSTHSTYRNIERDDVFTVSYPRPSQLLYSSLAASPRQEGGTKPVLEYFSTFPARKISGAFIKDAYLFFECRHLRTIDGFGENCLTTGKIVAAYAATDFLRSYEMDDQELIHDAPLFVYLAPDRFANIERSNAFPFPAAMRK